jgi:hypothetical protein
VFRLPREAESKGRQNGGKTNILNKKLIFCKKFKFLIQMKGNSINGGNFVKDRHYCQGRPL